MLVVIDFLTYNIKLLVLLCYWKYVIFDYFLL